ncbi:MAG: 1,4-alpha-glucan branching protein GlgB [Ruminococcus sp.]|nr:1,4-alpha-glucan branching protein GlgB [Ruminococcus sp.]
MYRSICEALEGSSLSAYEVFGAHPDDNGVRFTVYAPNAVSVAVIGDFNGWTDSLMVRTDNGVWTSYVNGAKQGDLYKYRIKTADGEVFDRADPFAFFSEKRPDTASVVYDIGGYEWTDSDWVKKRSKNFSAPLNIYEVHAGSWKKKSGEFMTYTELADELIPYTKEIGATHIELLPITEHPFDGSWGYQSSGYFSATSRYGNPHGLMQFIDRCHAEEIGVILDFVPVHFVGDYFALAKFDGGYIYESDYDDMRNSRWGTVLFDFTKPYVVSFLRSALEFWITEYHIDGIRFDAVSNMIYRNGESNCGINESGIWFLKYTNYTLSKRHPDVMLIAEDSSVFGKVTTPVEYGGLGFDYKWELGWMNNTLNFLSLPPERRRGKSSAIDHSMSYFYNENYLLPLSHDEVVHGKKSLLEKMYGSNEEKLAQLRLLYLYMFSHPGKKLLFMGSELASHREWNEAAELEWENLSSPDGEEISRFVRELYRIYRSERALYECDFDNRKFKWLDFSGRNCAFSYTRYDNDGKRLFFVLNFSNEKIKYNLNTDRAKGFEVLLDTDSKAFGGGGEFALGNKINMGRLEISLPAYSGVMLREKE